MVQRDLKRFFISVPRSFQRKVTTGKFFPQRGTHFRLAVGTRLKLILIPDSSKEVTEISGIMTSKELTRLEEVFGKPVPAGTVINAPKSFRKPERKQRGGTIPEERQRELIEARKKAAEAKKHKRRKGK